MLDGFSVEIINADLSSGKFDVSRVHRIEQNANVAFIGTQKGGPFDIKEGIAREWLRAPSNVNGLTNAEVVRPWANGMDVTRRPSDTWIVDFGAEMSEADAAQFERPFEYVREQVRPLRISLRRESHRRYWWRHAEARPGMRNALKRCSRFIVTPRVAKHRLFVWLDRSVVPDTRLVVIAKDDDVSYGILHSRIHGTWSLRTCSWHGVGNDPTYNALSCFETFPFPEGLTPNLSTKNYANDPRAQAIAKTAKRLDELRIAWLNPPDLVKIEPEVVPGYPDRVLPKDAQAAVTLKTRTLTNLYNQRPQWLADAHRDLDAAVAAAYGWPADISEEDALAKLLELNLARAGATHEPELIDEPVDED
jgi:type II restriction/modification system DNA methylase subunit YeeA